MSKGESKVDRIEELEKELAKLKAEREEELSKVRNKLKGERDRIVAEAHALINKAESLTNQIGDGFSWDLEYGMGGYYDGEEGRWCASSESC